MRMPSSSCDASIRRMEQWNQFGGLRMPAPMLYHAEKSGEVGKLRHTGTMHGGDMSPGNVALKSKSVEVAHEEPRLPL